MALVNKSKIKEVVELQVAGDFSLELENKVEEMVKKAEGRAKGNGRRTIFARDL